MFVIGCLCGFFGFGGVLFDVVWRLWLLPLLWFGGVVFGGL